MEAIYRAKAKNRLCGLLFSPVWGLLGRAGEWGFFLAVRGSLTGNCGEWCYDRWVIWGHDLASLWEGLKMRTSAERPQFLSGWKEIANYLGKGVRTVQRYERELGLPVRRPAGRPTGSVVATKAELDAWVTASPIREAFQLTKVEARATGMTESIHKGLAEMTRLREQMMSLRNELRRSVEMLSQSLYGMHGDLLQNQVQDKLRRVTLLEPQHRNKYVLDLLEVDSRGKAS